MNKPRAFKPDFIQTKVPQSVWTLVHPPNLNWKMVKEEKKKGFLGKLLSKKEKKEEEPRDPNVEY